MINVGIDGAGSLEAGELIRLLINHPDVRLVGISQPEFSGRDISDIHHGLIGERKIAFSSTLPQEDLDIIFYTSSTAPGYKERADEFVEGRENDESGFAIFLNHDDDLIDAASPYFIECIEDPENPTNSLAPHTLVYGIPELNRKPLVRGSHKAVVPSGLESAVVVGLLPLVKEVEMPEELKFHVKGAPEIVENYKSRQDRISKRLSATFSELTGRKTIVSFTFEQDDTTERSIRVSTDIPAASKTLDQLRNFVREAYDDHNMSHLSEKELSYHEVEGTDNCLIEINRIGSGLYRINMFADGRMRGASGEAVHIMNLFAGLFEKTGLHLKASRF